MEWFYENNGRQAGPVSREEILRLIMQQRIRPDTLVWTPEFGDVWRPANAAGLVSPLTGLLRLSSGISEHWAWVLLVSLVLFAVNVTERIYQLPQIENEIQARQEQSHPQVTPPASSKSQVNGQEDEKAEL